MRSHTTRGGGLQAQRGGALEGLVTGSRRDAAVWQQQRDQGEAASSLPGMRAPPCLCRRSHTSALAPQRLQCSVCRMSLTRHSDRHKVRVVEQC